MSQNKNKKEKKKEIPMKPAYLCKEYRYLAAKLR
jgi:hypothetical protein